MQIFELLESKDKLCKLLFKQIFLESKDKLCMQILSKNNIVIGKNLKFSHFCLFTFTFIYHSEEGAFHNSKSSLDDFCIST